MVDHSASSKVMLHGSSVLSKPYAAFSNTNTPSNGVVSSDEDQASASTVSSQEPPSRSRPTVLLPRIKMENSMVSSESPRTASSRTEDAAKRTDRDMNMMTHIQHGYGTSNDSALKRLHITSLTEMFRNIARNFTSSIFPSNYPFGSGYQDQSPSKKEILTYVPDRPTTMFLIAIYMDTIERTHPLLHPPTFHEELKLFWENPAEVDDGWLGQFLVMLGLGYHLSRGVNLRPIEEEILSKYFRGAGTCLRSTNFLFSPTLTSLRTLSMMVLSRRLLASTCLELDACGPLMSTVVRMAMAIGLNVDPRHDFGKTPFIELEMRRKLWTTIALMEASTSILTGTPFLFRSSDIDTQMPANLNNKDLNPSILHHPVIRPLSEFTDSTLSIFFARSSYMAFDVIIHANSTSTRLQYEDVLVYDLKLRSLLKEISQLYYQSPLAPPEEWKQNQKFMLEIFLRRILLALHSYHGLMPNADVEFPVSYWSTLECSLALLVIQRQLSEDSNSPQGRVWLGEYFKHDFYAATLTICLVVTRNDDGDTGINSKGSLQHNNIEIPQRETILQTVLCCRDIWARRICQTYCHFLSHMNLGTIIASMINPNNASVDELCRSSLLDSLRTLKNCKCGNCATGPCSVKGSLLNHPDYLAA
ncbi:hypothetical protein UA08_08008 [Talaromyces atroroseus]|uniref:Xylanolytic transcriptional activator regulatory domain-containing protein n=1 Tax=Talaromyces atroroseus TaxID=1441469 RepID=A0A225A9V5_TALAT|nr:hypothetical protein UA08_08008 [Talaromyces atroroseus]OKL56860.1 hypothetical protein UA08_08008 [Talaromyces atroroseus]